MQFWLSIDIFIILFNAVYGATAAAVLIACAHLELAKWGSLLFGADGIMQMEESSKVETYCALQQMGRAYSESPWIVLEGPDMRGL